MNDRLHKDSKFYMVLLSVSLQCGRDYEFDAPVKLLDKFLHAMAQSVDEQLVVVSQVFFPPLTSFLLGSFCFARTINREPIS